MSSFKIDSGDSTKTLRVDKDGCSVISPASIDDIARRVLELKDLELHLADAHALCTTYDKRVSTLIAERIELLQMLRLAAEDDYKKRTGFIHTITDSDVTGFIEALRLRVRKEF
jgi:hypothetical protein